MGWDDEPNADLDSNICPVCGSDECVPAYGDEDSPVLFIGEFPGDEEVMRGRPFLGRTGAILRNELLHEGYQLGQFRVMNLWRHPPNKNEQCFEIGVKECIREAKGKKLVILIGSDTVKYFTGKGVGEWNGLIVESTLLDAEKILAVVQPALAFHSSVGEVKFSMSRIAHHIKEIDDNE